MKCENCGQEHDGIYGSGRFCNSKCARGFSTKAKRQEINQKVSKKLSKEKYIKFCLNCNKEFLVSNNFHKKHIFCSHSCSAKYQSKINDNFKELNRQRGIKSAQIQNRRSKNEIYFAQLCQEHFNNIKCNEPIFNGWDADIVIEDYKIAILWNGKWHYEKLAQKHSVEQVQNRDKIKINEIKSCNYNPYIIKDMGSYNKDFVREQFNILLNFINNTKNDEV